MNVVIIDDKRKARQALIQMLADYCPSVKVIAEAEGVEKGIDVIINTRPDLILLDIKMKDGSGFDLIKKLTDVKSKIIFVTAYNEYAIKAFKFSAIDYLLKQINIDSWIEQQMDDDGDLLRLSELTTSSTPYLGAEAKIADPVCREPGFKSFAKTDPRNDRPCRSAGAAENAHAKGCFEDQMLDMRNTDGRTAVSPCRQGKIVGQMP